MKTPTTNAIPEACWESHIYLNTSLLALITLSCDCIVTSIIQFCSTPCFESHSHHFVSQTWHLPLSMLCDRTRSSQRIFFFFCHWIGSCYFSPDDSIMHGLYFQCFAHWVRVRADALQSESIATMNWQYWCLIEPFQWSRRRNKQKQASVNCPGMNFPPFSPGFII